MIELLTIAGGLRADRVMASFSGRAWSFNDPIPPVLPGVGDLRQRVVTIHRVDGTGARRDELVAEDGDIAEQVLRCHRLGHLLGLSAAVSRRLGFAATTVER